MIIDFSTVAERDVYLAIANPYGYETASILHESIEKLATVKNASCMVSVSDVYLMLTRAGWTAGSYAYTIEPTHRLPYRKPITVADIRIVQNGLAMGAVNLTRTAYTGAAA